MSAGERRRRSGTSLVEVLIAVTVLAIALLAFLSIMWSGSVLSASSRDATIAIYDLDAAREQTFAVTFAVLTAHPGGQFNFGAGNTHVMPGFSNLQNETITLIWLTASPDWTDPEHVTYSLNISFTNHKGFTQTDSITTGRSTQ